MTETLSAWVLPIGNGYKVALGRYQLKYIEYIEQSVTLPGLPTYCEEGFLWRGQFVPVLNLLGLATRRRVPEIREEKMVAVVVYEQSEDQPLGIGGLCLQGPPAQIVLDPTQSVAIEELEGVWSLLARAAFRTEDGLYPVLDLEQLFRTTPSELLKLH